MTALLVAPNSTEIAAKGLLFSYSLKPKKAPFRRVRKRLGQYEGRLQ
jgi:hypothetical protein